MAACLVAQGKLSNILGILNLITSKKRKKKRQLSRAGVWVYFGSARTM